MANNGRGLGDGSIERVDVRSRVHGKTSLHYVSVSGLWRVGGGGISIAR